jgi:hypothetical protein
VAGPFLWLTLTNAITALQNRLNAGAFWSPAELHLYLTEALRYRNALCEEWRKDFVFPATGAQWQNIGTLAGSPRLRTVTDADLYTEMQYRLLEPTTGGGTWTGTNQFNLQKLQYALSNRRNEVIQATACNLAQLAPIIAGVGTRRYGLPDTTLEARRVRYLPVSGFGLPAAITLTREDTQAFQDYSPGYLQESGIPQSWSVISDPPLEFAVDKSLLVPGAMDVIVLQSGPAFAPPTPSLLGIPDDWSWLPMYGALADLLGEEAESTDRQRAAYCLKRYDDGLKMFQQANWFLQATVNGVACDTPPLGSKDWFLPEWETAAGQIPCVVQDGIDFVAVAPGIPSSASLTLVQNAPILDATGTYIQVTRDSWDSVLGMAQHLAAFKMGGEDFATTMPLMDDFMGKCKQDNERVVTYGLYSEVLFTQGKEEDRVSPR